MKARTKKNFGRFFFVCPTRQVSRLFLFAVVCSIFGLSGLCCFVAVQRDGSGCQFWCWEDEYEEYLITHGHVDASYQPIFASNMKLVRSQVIPEHEANEGPRSPKAVQAVQDQILQKMNKLEKNRQGNLYFWQVCLL